MSETSAREPVVFSADCEPLFNAHPLPMWLYEPETLRFLAVNDAAVAAYGYSRAEFLAMTLRDIRGASAYQHLQGIEGRTPPYSTRSQHVDRAGREREVEVIVSEVGYEGRVVRMVTALDVTEVVGVRARADRQEQLLSVIAETLPDAVFVKDAELRYLFINSPGARALGRKPAEMIGRTDLEIYGQDLFGDEDRAAMAADGPTMLDSEINAGGDRIALSAVLAPWRAANGETLGLVGIARDVTAQRAAEAKISVMHERYHLAFEHAPMGMGLVDLGGRFIYSNRALCVMLGYTADELTRMTFSDVTHPEDRAHTITQYALLLSGRADHVETAKRYVRKDGSIVWARRSAAMVRDDAGQPLYSILQAQDITHEYQMEELLAQSEQQHRLLFETMADGVVFHDADGLITQANPAAYRLLGDALEITNDRARFAPLIRTLREDGSAMPIEERPWRVALNEGRDVRDVVVGLLTLHDAQARWFMVNSMPRFLGGEQRAHQVYTTFSDITRLRAAEAERRAGEERFRTLVQEASEMVLVIDVAMNLSFISESSAKVLGYQPAESVGRKALSFVHADDFESARAVFAEVMRQPGAMMGAEMRVRHKSGEWRTMACVLRNMFDHPSIRGIVVNASDITDKRRTEIALKEREAELRQAQKMEAVGRLAGGIAHDFNNVLTAITGHAEFLAEMFDEGHPVQSDVEGIRESAARAARLTRQLLAFSRRQLMQRTDLDLREVLSSTEQMLRRLIGEHIDLTCVVPDEPLIVHADRTQIEQVIVNLAVNARDAMPDGGRLALSLSAAEYTDLAFGNQAQPAPGPYAVLRVEDSGSGIPAELLEKIFEPFFTTKEQGAGSGLGLSTAYGIVKQSGGHVFVTSGPGAGTRFDVLLPRIARNPARELSVPADTGAQPRGAETVLIVEDESGVRNMAERVLRRYGYTVLSATHGAQALEVLRDYAGHVSLVVTDVVMPVMSGPELATALAGRYHELPIVFMSGYTADEINEEGIKAAGAAFIAKPFAPNELAQIVRATLDRKNREKAAEAGRSR